MANDNTVDTIPLVLWSSAELAVINIAACILTLRPLYLWLADKDPKGQTSKSSAYVLGDHSNNGRFERMPRQGSRGAPLDSLVTFDHNIHQTRRYDVNVDGQEELTSKAGESSVGTGAAVWVRHGY